MRRPDPDIMVPMLLDAGLDPNTVEVDTSLTLLHRAAMWNSAPVCEVFHSFPA